VTPVSVPPGWTACSIGESPISGLVRRDRAGGIILRGAGEQIWDIADQFYYLCRPVTGDFQAAVTALTTPIESNEWSRAGLTLRDVLAPGARNAYLFTSAAHGLIYQWRSTANDTTDSLPVIQTPYPARTTLKLPILLRIIRRGSTVALQYS